MSSTSNTASSNARPIEWRLDGAGRQLTLYGDWLLAQGPEIERVIKVIRSKLSGVSDGQVTFEMAGVDSLDTFGATALMQLRNDLVGRKVDVTFAAIPARLKELLDRVLAVADQIEPCPPEGSSIVNMLARLGRGAKHVMYEGRDLLGFLGLILRVLGRTLLDPRRLRLKALVNQMETTGINALPIVGLLSLLIGMVLAYLSAIQLQNFGAEILVVDIVGLAVLREIGILLAAIILAGRSGSAFTAQIGTMKVNEEVDAMRTMGLDVIEVLVLPRILGLVITLPLVGFYAAMAGLLGGGLAGYFTLDIGPAIFLEQLRLAVGFNDLLVTLIKAPVFAFTIAMVGCFQGLRVSGSAQSVGEMTTKSVVVSICLVIVLDALFSILFQELGI